MGKAIRGVALPGHPIGSLPRVEGEDDATVCQRREQKGWLGRRTLGPRGRSLPPIANKAGPPLTQGRNPGDRTLKAGVLPPQLRMSWEGEYLGGDPVKHPTRRPSFRQRPGNDFTGMCPATPRRVNTQRRVVMQSV